MKNSLLPMGKVWFLDVLGVEGKILKSWFAFFSGDLCVFLSSWWLNHPFEKCKSKWVHLPPSRGRKHKNHKT